MNAEHIKYHFEPTMLEGERSDGVSAFMRIRNGQDFLKLTIESHIDFFDEIIACYNQCTDNTEKILQELQKKYPNKLKVYHYEPIVYPLGGVQHQNFAKGDTTINIIHSMANYSNFALAKTTKKIAVKLDDDHLAIPANLSKALKIVRANGFDNLYAFSGINLMRQGDNLGVAGNFAFSGNGDIFFFPVSKKAFFVNEATWEKFFTKNLKLKKVYLGLLYFHLKFLKADQGLSNYQIDNLQDKTNSLYEYVNRINNQLEFISLEQFAKVPLKDFSMLMPYYHKSLKYLKNPYLNATLISWFKKNKNNLKLYRALTFYENMQAALKDWENTKNILLK